MTLVLDASVWLKWLLADPLREPDTERAIEVVKSCLAGDHRLLLPAHWLAEVAAVTARLSPSTAVDDVVQLYALELETSNEPEVWSRAVALAVTLGQHVFDTLYHAVALENGATLVTADGCYAAKAKGVGGVLTLSEW